MSFFIQNIKWLKESYPEKVVFLPKEISNDFCPTPKELLKIVEVFNYTLNQLVNNDLSLIEKLPFNKIKWLVLDVDGTMTDGGMIFSENGDEIKQFNTKDGMAIRMLQKSGIEVVFLSSGVNGIVKRRAEMLGINRHYCGKAQKMEILGEWMQDAGLSFDSLAYIGDDINDGEVIQKAAISACPADAVQNIKEKVNIILQTKGGKGCVREFSDDYLLKRK